MNLPDPNQTMDFGKHRGLTYGHIIVKDEEYCRWAETDETDGGRTEGTLHTE